MERDVGGGIGMGNTCKPMAVSFQCMTKSTTIKKERKKKKSLKTARRNTVIVKGNEYDPCAIKGFPGGTSGKESACQHRRLERCRLIPGSRRSLGEENGNPLQYSCLENSMDRGAWRATFYAVTKSGIQLRD